MTSRLTCYSFHSVKGGVGKSTLSTFTACALAQAHPNARVYLIDMDLTGTSLADVLPLEAPQWDGVGVNGVLNLLTRPNGFHSRKETRDCVKHRDRPTATPEAIGVPFLNDYLLFEPKDWDTENDIHHSAISWRMPTGPANLRVFPSSALPRDLSRAIPVIYDEEHAAFLEARLEYLLSAILEEEEETYVVFDTPPTIPGLSRTVLNLAFRLSRELKTPLAADGFIPFHLEDAVIDWRAKLVATQDYQDIRAVVRWLGLVEESDRSLVQLVINRARGARGGRENDLRLALTDFDSDDVVKKGHQIAGIKKRQSVPREHEKLRDPNEVNVMNSLNALIRNLVWIDEHNTFQEIFRSENTPSVDGDFLNQLTPNLSNFNEMSL